MLAPSCPVEIRCDGWMVLVPTGRCYKLLRTLKLVGWDYDLSYQLPATGQVPVLHLSVMVGLLLPRRSP
jgi:hypothetical protein